MNAETIHVLVGSDAGRSFPIGGELILGRLVRGPGQLGGDAKISREHARISRGPDGELIVEDLASANGTYLNGVRIAEPQVLHDGDAIRVGQTELEFRTNGISQAPRGGESLEPPNSQQARRVATTPPGAQPAELSLDTEPLTQAGPPRPNAAAVPPAHHVAGGSPATRAQPVAERGSSGEVAVPSAGRSLAPSSGSATLLHAGERIALGEGGATVGRAEDSTIRVDSDRASRHHARFDVGESGFYVTDLGSTNGTYLNGQRLNRQSHWLANGDTVTAGGATIRFLAGEATQFGGQVPRSAVIGTQTIQFDGAQLRLGRDASNDVVLTDPNVSRFHAEIVAVPGGYELRDVGSRNGTRLDGHLVDDHSPIQIGSEIGVGPFRLIWDGAAFLARDDRGSLRLDAEQVIVDVKGRRILDNATIDVQPGEFVAIIGESGSGKTTLIKALAGVSNPSSGTVTVNGEPISSRLSEIGYVPQDEIVHRDLSVREALTYAARLRLPPDSSNDEIKTTVDAVLSELSLDPHADTRVGSLSGGQRKRAGVGTELVNRPGLLFLDEATTGLDPGLERRMMQLMRDLANNARAVVTITHATKNLGMCDKIAVMGRGGHLCFFGAPADALGFFGVPDYDGIYEALETTSAEQWRGRWEAETSEKGPFATIEQPPVRRVAGRTKVNRGVLSQAAILAERYILVMVRDRRNLLILLGQVPILAILISAIFHANVLRLGAAKQSGIGTQLIFLLVTVVIWIGSIDSAREIIKERTVFVRERAVGVRTSAYLLSKTMVLFCLAAIQTIILCAIVFGLRRIDAPPMTYIEAVALLVATSWAAVGMGLALSSFVSTENQAMSFIPLALIPQLLFAGEIEPLQQLPAILRGLATLIFARWSFAGIGGTLDFYHRFALDPSGQGQVVIYGTSFFKLTFAPTLGILGGFIAVFLMLVVLGLRRDKT